MKSYLTVLIKKVEIQSTMQYHQLSIKLSTIKKQTWYSLEKTMKPLTLPTAEGALTRYSQI